MSRCNIIPVDQIRKNDITLLINAEKAIKRNPASILDETLGQQERGSFLLIASAATAS
jgi:hypothetical protein